MFLSPTEVPWLYALAVLVDVLALVSIWTSTLHSARAKLLWTVIVALLPFLGALAWFPLGRERRR